MNKPESSVDEWRAKAERLIDDYASTEGLVGLNKKWADIQAHLAAHPSNQVLQEPVAQEVRMLTNEQLDAIISQHSQTLACAESRRALMRVAIDAARPRELIESVAKAIYQQWDSLAKYVEWVDGGNSIRQDHARSIAREALAVPLLPEQPPESRWQRLYTTVNELMAYMGAHGSADAKGDRASAVMDALHAIDGGTVLPEQPIAEQPQAEQQDSVYLGSAGPSEGTKTALPRWIPVSERLPDFGVPVWLHEDGRIWTGERSDDADGWLWANCYDSHYYDKRDKDWKSGSAEVDDDYNPSHWMPLPLPPGESAGEVPSDKKYLPSMPPPAASLPVSAPAGQEDALTPDEIAEVLSLLKDHDGSDFEPECPACTAYRKFAAMSATTKEN